MTVPYLAIVYASQQGTSKGIAEDLHDECSENNIKSSVFCISEFGKQNELIQELDCVIFIAATTGDGEPPDTARKFWRILNKKSSSLVCSKSNGADFPLSYLSYTILGLGDTNYTNFCNFSKNLDGKLCELGAKRFYNCGFADDGTGLEVVIEPWKEGLWKPLKQHLFALSGKSEKSLLEEKEPMDELTDRNICTKDDEEKTMASTTNEIDELSSKLETAELTDKLATSDVISEKWRNGHVLLQNSFPSDASLTIPKIPAFNQISLEWTGKKFNPSNYESAGNLTFPFAASDVFTCPVANIEPLSKSAVHKTVKKTSEISLQLPEGKSLDYQPGDSIGVIAENDTSDVDYFISLLRIENADEECTLSASSHSKRSLASHLPRKASLREIFTKCVDFRCVPKKAMLLHLLETCLDATEKRCLQELVSKEGAQVYQSKIINNGMSFLDLLSVFRSCDVRLSALLEFLPRLLPRAYSLTSSPLLNKGKILSFAYSLLEIPSSDCIYKQRLGVCTGLFDKLSQFPSNNQTLSLYLRNAQTFRLPDDVSKPVILVGPGTGIAPLVGFLRHRRLQVENQQQILSDFGKSWLFFGCRYSECDQLYERELSELVKFGVLSHLYVCFSREGESDVKREGESDVKREGESDVKYVQDLIRKEKTTLVDAIIEDDAHVFVCGDAKNMAKDVYNAFIEILSSKLDDDATQFLLERQKQRKYLQDVWT